MPSTVVPPRPSVLDPAPWNFPEPDRWELDNGLAVQAFDVPGQHVLSLRLGIPAPLAAEPQEVEGVGLIMARCLDEGSERHTLEEMAELLERKGIAMGAGLGERGLVVEVDVASRHLPAALDLLTECLTSATYPEPEVRRQVRNRLADIAHEHADAGSRAALEFIATYFDPGDRASRPTGGTRGSVAAITAEAVRAYHAGIVHPDHATVVLAGDLTGTDLQSLIGRTLGSWPARHPVSQPAVALREDPGRRAPDAGQIVFVDRPGSVQTELYVGRPGPDRHDPHGWGAYQVLSFLVGGSPSARVDRVLREDKGFTYGIRAGFRPRARGGLFVAAGSVRGDATAEALDALLQVLDLRGADLAEHEVRAAADFVARTAPGRYATADAVADEAVGLALDGLRPEFVTSTLAQARALTGPQATDAWDAHVQHAWTVVLVGDAEANAEQVRALGRGPVRTVQSRRPSSEPNLAEYKCGDR